MADDYPWDEVRKRQLPNVELEIWSDCLEWREAELLDAEAEVQRMGADRSRLAESLDSAEARAKRLEETNREVDEGSLKVAADPKETYVAPAKQEAAPYLNFAPLENAMARLKKSAGDFDATMPVKRG